MHPPYRSVQPLYWTFDSNLQMQEGNADSVVRSPTAIYNPSVGTHRTPLRRIMAALTYLSLLHAGCSFQQQARNLPVTKTNI